MKFYQWMENTGGPVTLQAKIPISREVYILDTALRHGDSGVEIYVVGGAVRDYLYHQFHGRSSQYKPKDVDLTTNLSEEEILQKLRIPYAIHLGIRVKEKTSVDTFGVIFASVNGSETYEIAPFRKDIGSADGRRPERVERGTIYEDAMRRDLTINNLYYDFHKGLVLDFNPGGQGIEDVRNRTVRTAGDPFQRFEEDKLRVLRILRFFSRFNPGLIRSTLDQKTLGAIEQYRDLRRWGISAERIYEEFAAGMKQSLVTSNYLQNYSDLGLFDAVFPGLSVNIAGIPMVGNSKNFRAILAWLLKDNQDIANKLNRLKYPNEVSAPVQFLITSLNFGPSAAFDVVRSRDKQLLGPNATITPEEIASRNESISLAIKQDLLELARMAGEPEIANRLTHLSNYQSPRISGEELMGQGYQGRAIGDEQRRRTADHYQQSYQDYLRKTSQGEGNRVE